MACSDQIGTEDLENAKLDAITIAELANSRLGGESGGALIDGSTTRLGDTFSTLRGQLKKLGYEVPIAYTTGIVFTVDDGAKTVDEGGIIYAPRIDALPLTTTGTWATDSDGFYVVQNAAGLSNYIVETYAQLDSIPYQATGNVITVTDEDIAGDWIVEDGAHTANVGTIRDFTNAVGNQHLKRLYGNLVYPEWFNDTGSADYTTAFTLAANFAAANGHELSFADDYPVTTIVLDGLSGFLWSGRGSLVGAGTGTYDAVIELKNCSGMRIEGDVAINGSSNSGYSAGVLAWTDGVAASNYNNWNFSAVVYVKRAYQIGKPSEPDWALSENSISGGYLFSVAQGVVSYGAQNVVTITDFQNAVNATAWGGVTPINLAAYGATILSKGGELLHALDTAGQLCLVETIESITYNNQYGNIIISDCVTEGAAPLFNSSNTLGLSSPDAGSFSATNCIGKHTQNLASYIETDSSFTGIVSTLNNNWAATSARSLKNITIGNSAVRVYKDNKSFGVNMLQGDNGVSGGTLYFSRKLILDAYDTTTNNGLINGSVGVIYDSINTQGNDLNYHSVSFSPATGVFTVPDGGLNDITVNMYQKVNLEGVVAAILIDGVVSRSQAIQLNDHTSWNYPYLSEGTTISIRLTAGGLGFKTGGSQDRFQIIASRTSIN